QHIPNDTQFYSTYSRCRCFVQSYRVSRGSEEVVMHGIAKAEEEVARVYEGMNRKIAQVRTWLHEPLTLADKILFGHLENPSSQRLERGRSCLSLLPDRVVLQDVLGQTGMLQFMQTGRTEVAVPT